MDSTDRNYCDTGNTAKRAKRLGATGTKCDTFGDSDCRSRPFMKELYRISTVFAKDLALSGRRRLDDNGSTFSGALKSKSFRDQKEGRRKHYFPSQKSCWDFFSSWDT